MSSVVAAFDGSFEAQVPLLIVGAGAAGLCAALAAKEAGVEALVIEVLNAFKVRRCDQTEKACVDCHKCEELRLRPDRGLALSFDIGDDIVDRRHGDVETRTREIGHLGHRIRRALNLDRDIVLVEKALVLADIDRPVEATRKDVDGDDRFCGHLSAPCRQP